MRRILAMAAVGMVAVAAMPTTPAMGGWVVITIEDLPRYLEAGQPTALVFTLRQHGESPVRGREPTVRVRAVGAGWLNRGDRFDAVEAGPTSPGGYVAMVSADEPGMVEITIDTDVNRQRSVLLPVRVAAVGAPQVSQTMMERGRELFVAKGCATCHLVGDDEEVAERNVLRGGPPLTGRHLPAAYVSRAVSDPDAERVPGNWGPMPRLGLSDAEVGAIAEYLSRRVVTASR